MSYRPNNKNNSNRWRNGHYEGNYNIGDPYPIKGTWANIGHITQRVYVNHFPDKTNNELELYYLCGLPNFIYGNENSLKFEKTSQYPKKFRGVYPYVYFVKTWTKNVISTTFWYIDNNTGKIKPYIGPILPFGSYAYNSNCCFGINGKISLLGNTFTAEQNPEITLNGDTFRVGIYSSKDKIDNETVYQWRAEYEDTKNRIFPYGRGHIDKNGIVIDYSSYNYHEGEKVKTFKMEKGEMYTPYIFTIIKKNISGTEEEIMSEIVTITKELLNLYWDITEYPEIKNYDMYDELNNLVFTLNYNKKERTNGFKNRNKKSLDTNLEKVKPGFILPYNVSSYVSYSIVEKQTINI